MDAPLNKPNRISKPASEIDALFNSIGEGVIVTDSTAHISRVNKIALEILGFKEKELIGEWFPDVVPVDDEQGKKMSNIDRPMGQVFLTGETISTRAFYQRKNGSKIPVFLSVSPVLMNGKPVGAIEVFRDITKELELEQAKDEFVAIASHQLRTPATAVKQYVGLLLEGYADPLTESQREFLERAYESNERQLHIVQEILKISQLDLQKVIFKPKKIDAMDVIEEAVAGLHSNFEDKKQKIVIEKPRSQMRVMADREQLRTAIENLLENASNYTWEGKTITVKAKETKDCAMISVSDEGVGISRKDIPKLFQKFTRLPNPLSVQVGGTGLGLYWAAKIIEMHGGEIKVESKPNKGSIFTICLPKESANI